MTEHTLKLTGKTSLAEALDASKDATIQATISIYEVAKKDLFNGDFEMCYKGKIISEVLVAQSEKIIRSKDTSSESQKTRGAIHALQNEVEKLDIDQQVFYEQVQKMIRRNLVSIYETYKNEV